jgi:sterol desaturase/sphingolipid hydroxylase (fatty acid hydroxylase superfamily)
MRAVTSWLVLPIVTIGSVVAMGFAIRLDVPPMIALSAGAVIVAAVVTLLERILPFSDVWRRPRGDLPADVWHLAVNVLIVESVPPLVVARWTGLVGPWPSEWPIAAQAVLAVAVADLVGYGLHRLLHGPLWRFHAVHHSAPRLYWVNSWRLHPIESLCYFVTTVAPLILLGVPREVTLFTLAFTTSFRMLQHSNVSIRLGWLNHLFAGPEVHRWHHSPAGPEANANYGNVFFVWDHLFRTAHVPAGRPPPIDVGLPAGETHPTAYAAQLAWPFRRRRR